MLIFGLRSCLVSSEEPRPGLFGFSVLGAASCVLKLDSGELRYTYGGVETHLPFGSPAAACDADGDAKEQSNGWRPSRAEGKGTLLIGINLGVAQVVTTVWRTKLGTMLWIGLKLQHHC